jgi:hypothetical protein
MDLSTIIKLALATGLCTAIFNQVFALFRETIQRREKQRLRGKAVALNLVGMLTAYAQQCNSLINWSKYEEGEGGLGRYDFPDMPPLPQGPIELLPSKVAAGLQDLRNEIEEAKRDIAGVLEVDGPSEAAQVANYRCADVRPHTCEPPASTLLARFVSGDRCIQLRFRTPKALPSRLPWSRWPSLEQPARL